jgi:succinate-acetate transporter protein
MAKTDLVPLPDRHLHKDSDLESGSLEDAPAHITPSKAAGIANPAPLGLLGFGMTTGVLRVMLVHRAWHAAQ